LGGNRLIKLHQSRFTRLCPGVLRWQQPHIHVSLAYRLKKGGGAQPRVVPLLAVIQQAPESLARFAREPTPTERGGMPKQGDTPPSIAPAGRQQLRRGVIPLGLLVPSVPQAHVHDRHGNLEEGGGAFLLKAVRRKSKTGSGGKSDTVAPPERSVVECLGALQGGDQAIERKPQPVLPATQRTEAQGAHRGVFVGEPARLIQAGV